tara:strand:+ start:53979 stop:54353 length:375 start_codon:yes stop_codon:yes gene_type:complete
MFLKDLTEEQSIEILNLVFPFPDNIKSDILFKYQEYDASMYEDSCELIILTFNCTIHTDEEILLRVFIFEDLSMEVSYADESGNDMVIESLPIRNPYFIYKKFREWSIYPNIIEQRESEIEKLL